MKTSTTHRLLNHLQEAVLEGKNAMENVLSSAYDEFSDHLASLAESGLPIPKRLRRLRHMETELDAYMNMAGSRVDSRTHIYLMKASGLVRTEIELLHFAPSVSRMPRYRSRYRQGTDRPVLPSLERFLGEPDGTDRLTALPGSDNRRQRQPPSHSPPWWRHSRSSCISESPSPTICVRTLPDVRKPSRYCSQNSGKPLKRTS